MTHVHTRYTSDELFHSSQDVIMHEHKAVLATIKMVVHLLREERLTAMKCESSS